MLNKIKFRVKILAIPAIGMLVMLLALFFFNKVLTKNEVMLEEVVNGYVPAWQKSQTLLTVIDGIQASLQNAVASEENDEVINADKKYDEFQTIMNEQISNKAIADNVFPRDELVTLKNDMDGYYKIAREATSRLLSGETGEKMIFTLERMTEQYNNIKKKLQQNSLYVQENLNDKLSDSQKTTKNTMDFIKVVVFVVVLLIFGLSMIIANNILDPLNILINLTQKVADGDLSVRVPDSDAKDESGILLRTFKQMIENLANMTKQIKEAANSLASASAEISASVTQIASGATETATAANETSTTVEEVRQTALDSNRKAKHVSESSQKAVQVSQAGEKAVTSMVDAMRQIEAQMESIAESIMKLSEHGQAIGGIIATVEDVAEQSNLLAVNASIEAAKAGEHGKGFSVVALEVKNLAEQSRQATARVRNILDDIQKSTSGAVMTTEQGTKAVESGVFKSSEASDSIQRLANNVAEAAQATTQIAVSSQEQLVGMDQVVSAMESIKQASTQNVSATKQVESAAHDLHELGQRLKGLVEQYVV